jgi:ubiquinone/menaquinone biosynthesis C-methylase UbiE
MNRVPEEQAIAEVTNARHFNEFMGNNQFRQEEYRQLARRVVDLGIPPGGKVLDIGTGPGFVAIEIARLLQGTGAQVVGLDMSPAMLTLAAENAARAGLNGTLTWREGDAQVLPFAPGEFDVVVSNDSLHHWADPLPIFNEIARVVKANGGYILHDSRRLEQVWPRFVAWLIGLTIPGDFRVHYWGSINASYTPAELQHLLTQSRLQGWHIEQDFMNAAIVKARS